MCGWACHGIYDLCVMGSDEVDEIGYRHEPKDNGFKIKGDYLIPRTTMYSVPCVCHCVNNHSAHTKLVIDNGIWNRLMHTKICKVQEYSK